MKHYLFQPLFLQGITIKPLVTTCHIKRKEEKVESVATEFNSHVRNNALYIHVETSDANIDIYILKSPKSIPANYFQVTDHVMAGIEVIVGQFHGDNHLRV